MSVEHAKPFPPLAVLNFHALRMTRQYGPDNEMTNLRDQVTALVEAAHAAHMALIGYLPAHRNAVTDAAIEKIGSALKPFGGA